MAGVSMGWFGIESYTTRYGALVKTGPLYRADQDIEPMPELAKSWEWSADGKAADHAPDRRRQVVGWRAVHRR